MASVGHLLRRARPVLMQVALLSRLERQDYQPKTISVGHNVVVLILHPNNRVFLSRVETLLSGGEGDTANSSSGTSGG